MFELIFEQLRLDRHARRIRQSRVAARAGLDRATVHNGEHGRLNTLAVLIDWAYALDWQLVAVTPNGVFPINSATRLGHVLRSERRLRRLTQTRLAELTGSQPAEMSRWEQGRREPKLATLARWTPPLEVRFELRRLRRTDRP